MPGVLSIIFIGILGALIGSFANVVIYRLPQGKSIVYPGSSCPHCGHKITPLENIPILSWLALRGRCRSCREPISARYPTVEALTALGFVLLALRWPVEQYALSVLPLLIIFAMLVMMSLIDIDHYLLPDALTLPAVVVGLVGTWFYAPSSGLPTFEEALLGGALGAGVIALINRLGGLVLRRLADTEERLWPLGMDQVNLAALGGALGGWLVGLALAGLSTAVNLISRKIVRLPEPVLYGLWLVALLLITVNPWVSPVMALSGTFAAAGSVAVLGAAFWWLSDIGKKNDSPEDLGEEEEEPIAMGFGDVKLAALLGVMLGWQGLLVALFLSFIFGACGGLIGRAFGGGRQVPFGPYLTLGGLVALFFGMPLITWYLGLLGVS